ncbi:hypothetical protein KJ359_001667 [Pestalotiopsis sp. 9143b]|nr:hypothetical protein KJ359_001667 [Pestalotiopsis sp. 9143b]
MLVARDQENLVARHQTGAVAKQQQNNQIGNRYPKTPIKIPLNDENGGHLKGAKSILGDRTRGNENAASSKGFKGRDKSNFVTPLQPRNRAVLGDKTTNAKSRGPQTVNVKSAIKDIGGQQSQAPATIKPKQKQSQVETQKLQIHSEEPHSLSDEEPEYCPPRPKDLPYESNVFPEGVLTFEALKPENRLKGFYQHYFDPIDENGVGRSSKEQAEKTRKAFEDGDKKILEDIQNFEWTSIQGEIDSAKKVKPSVPSANPAKAKGTQVRPPLRKPLGSVTSKNAARVLTNMDDTTKSMQRRMSKSAAGPATRKKAPSFAIPRFTATRPSASQPTAARRTPMANIEANSRTTLGYNKGRAAASALASATAKPAVKRAQGALQPKASGLPRSATILSNDSDKTITPARFATKEPSPVVEDQLWKERVPFLSIFNPEDDDDCDLAGSPPPESDDEEFEMQFPQ